MSMDNEKFYCMIVGTRTFNDYGFLKRKADYYLQNHKADTVIVSGGARGTDSLARRYAEEKGYEYHEFPADWNTYGKSAGYRRNEEMHRFIAGHENRGVIAFWDGQSRGTEQNFDLARRYGNQIIICNI